MSFKNALVFAFVVMLILFAVFGVKGCFIGATELREEIEDMVEEEKACEDLEIDQSVWERDQ